MRFCCQTKQMVGSSTSLLHDFRKSKLTLRSSTGTVCSCLNRLSNPLQASYTVCGSPNGLSKPLQASYTLYIWVFRIAYCLPFSEQTAHEYQQTCQELLDTVKECHPQLLQNRKIHILLHLVENMRDFGPCSGFNTDRYDCTVTYQDVHPLNINLRVMCLYIRLSFGNIDAVTGTNSLTILLVKFERVMFF